MAQKGVRLDQETFSCCICLDPLKDPVTIPCGHSYCMNCIKTHWDGEKEKKLHSCPQCRQTFTPRPVLVKNTMLADLVEELKKTGLQAAPADHCYAGPEDVSCDVCTGRKLKAFKSCLVCLVSYCEKHLQPHYESPAFENHKLVDPSNKLQENICSRHDEVMKIFCRTDQQCICYLCLMDEHKGHDTVSAAAERTERQRELEVSRLNIQQRIQDREKDVELLQQQVENINLSADKAVGDNRKIFTELIRLMEERSSDVKQQVRSQQRTEVSRVKKVQEKEISELIRVMQRRRYDVKQQVRSQQRTEVSRVKELQEKLEQEITELKRNDAELQQLSHTEDHNQFLHNYPSLSPLSESTDSSSIKIRPLSYFEDVTAAVSEVRDKLQDLLREKWTNISLMVTEVDVLLPQAEPKTRAEFLKYSGELTLDPNTANTKLLLSDGNKKATFMSQEQSYSIHPDRFTSWCQVLSRESLTGRCYWEVECRGRGVYIAVAYKGISRTGDGGESGVDVAVAYKDISRTWDGGESPNSRLRSSVLQSRSVPGSQCSVDPHIVITVDPHIVITVDPHIVISVDPHIVISVDPHIVITVDPHIVITVDPHIVITVDPHIVITVDPHIVITVDPHIVITVDPHIVITVVPHIVITVVPHIVISVDPHIVITVDPHIVITVDPHIVISVDPHIVISVVPHIVITVVPHIVITVDPHIVITVDPHIVITVDPHIVITVVPHIVIIVVPHIVITVDPHIVISVVPHIVITVDPHIVISVVPHIVISVDPHIVISVVPHIVITVDPHIVITVDPHIVISVVPHIVISVDPHIVITVVPHIVITVDPHIVISVDPHIVITVVPHIVISVDPHIVITVDPHIVITVDPHIVITVVLAIVLGVDGPLVYTAWPLLLYSDT
ncbi:E3 ubiquitin/ISG15 ligase TRIM25-like [Lycodopsis pacificus]